MDSQSIRIELELECDAEPIEGRFRDEWGGTASFVGWLELIALLESARAGIRDDRSGEGDWPS